MTWKVLKGHKTTTTKARFFHDLAPFIHYTLPQKSGSVLCYTLRTILSVRPSISTSFPDSNSSSFWPIFFKLCMDIDIGEDWFGIANGLHSFINNRVTALDWCKNVFFLDIFRTDGWILIKFCTCIDIYKILVVSNARYFWSIFNKSYGPWSTSEFCLCSIFCELICGFRWNFVFALILTRCRFGWLNNIFFHFQELWPLIDAEISFMINILWTSWWILIKFCKCIDIDKM